MNGKIAVLFFAVATLLQLSHCIPTHRYARETPDWTSRIKEYMNKIPGYGSSTSQAAPSPATQPETQPETTSYQPSATAASELHPLIATKEGSSSVPSIGSYMPAGMPNMPNMPNMPSMPNMQSYYPSTMPQSMNPGNYMNSIPGGSTNAAGSAGSASAPEASIAAKEGSSSVPSIGSYMPAGMPNMPNMPSMPNMQSYYPSTMPQSMNPGNYMNSIPGGSTNAAGSAGSASAPEASIAAKEGSSSVPSIGSYMPAGMPNMPNMPSMPNMQSYYPSTMPQSMNPGNYMNSIPGGSTNAAGTTGSASAPGSV